MRPNLRTLFGSILLIVISLLYAWITVAVASARLGAASGWTHLVFFAITGLFWILPAMGLIRWMYKPRP